MLVLVMGVWVHMLFHGSPQGLCSLLPPTLLPREVIFCYLDLVRRPRRLQPGQMHIVRFQGRFMKSRTLCVIVWLIHTPQNPWVGDPHGLRVEATVFGMARKGQ